MPRSEPGAAANTRPPNKKQIPRRYAPRDDNDAGGFRVTMPVSLPVSLPGVFFGGLQVEPAPADLTASRRIRDANLI